MANRNVTYKIQDLIPIAVEEFNGITSEDWRKTCRHSFDEEIRLYNQEVGLETTVDSLIINLDDNDDDDDDSYDSKDNEE